MDAYSQPEDRKVRVKIVTTDFSCEGLVHLPGIRLSDVMNEKNQFLIVVQATIITDLPGDAGQTRETHQTLFIRKGEISYAVPLDDDQQADNRL